jgi:hypothetical protein
VLYFQPCTDRKTRRNVMEILKSGITEFYFTCDRELYTIALAK